jgi:hypothetical protein
MLTPVREALKGIVKRWIKSTGYGFIEPEEGGEDKRARSVVLIVLIALSMFTTFVPKAIASENVIFQDDFESYAVGTFPSAGGWSIVWNGAGDQYQAITDSYYSSPTKSLQLMGSYGWSVVVKKDFSSSSNIIGYEAYMMASPGGGGSVAFCNIPIETWGKYHAMVALGTDGYIWACEKNNEGIHQLQPFTPYTWYKIRVVVDRTAKLYNVWIDDVLERQNIPIYYDPWEILSLQFQVGWVSIKNYFDNVKVFEVSGSPPHGGLPYPPRNLQAYPVDPYTIGQSFSMHLYWDPPQSTPSLVQGYKIYRGLSSTRARAQL